MEIDSGASNFSIPAGDGNAAAQYHQKQQHHPNVQFTFDPNTMSNSGVPNNNGASGASSSPGSAAAGASSLFGPPINGMQYTGFQIRDTVKAQAHGGVVVSTPYGQGTLIRFELDKAYVRLSWGSEIVIQASKVQFHQQHNVDVIAQEIQANKDQCGGISSLGPKQNGNDGSGIFGYYCNEKESSLNPLKRRDRGDDNENDRGSESGYESTTASKSRAYSRPQLSPDTMDDSMMGGGSDTEGQGAQQHGGVKRCRRQEPVPGSLAFGN